jgi:hypothetical protein
MILSKLSKGGFTDVYIPTIGVDFVSSIFLNIAN